VCSNIDFGYQCKCKAGFKGDAAKNKAVKCTFDAASARPSGGYGDYKGVVAKTDTAFVTFGAKSDVVLARTGGRKLLVDADVTVAGKMSVKGLDLDVELKRVHDQQAVLSSLRMQLYQQAKANMQFLWKADESLVLYSRFETMQGNTFKDLSHYGNHIKPSQSTKLAAGGKYCKGLSIPFGGQLVIPHSKSLDFSENSFSISVWTNLKGRPYPRTTFTIKKGSGCYFGKGRGGALPGWEFGHGYRGNGVDFCLRDKEHNQARTGLVYDAGYTNKELEDTWSHTVWVVDREAQVASSYINGKEMKYKFTFDVPAKLTDKSDDSMDSLSNNEAIVIGNTYGWRMDGMIDELRIYRRALSASEARALYKITPPEHSC